MRTTSPSTSPWARPPGSRRHSTPKWARSARALVHHGSAIAWVGFHRPAGARITSQLRATRGYLDRVAIRWDHHLRATGPAGVAFSERRTVMVDDTWTDALVARGTCGARWRSRVLAAWPSASMPWSWAGWACRRRDLDGRGCDQRRPGDAPATGRGAHDRGAHALRGRGPVPGIAAEHVGSSAPVLGQLP